jgi:NADPH-dependent 2,4-dienoyl-CoA reductase/sulfur reductase-like enzyme
MPDLLVVGAGPAGLAAADEAANRGLSVALIDENAAPGGRIWQALERRGATDAEEAQGLALIRTVRAHDRIQAYWNAAVWSIEPAGRVYFSQYGAARCLSARHILLATGALERPLPVPGWTLPGVMTVGAAQIALKTGGLRPDGATWLAGQGPLLLLYANQVLAAHGRLAGIIDLSDGFAPLRALPRLSPAAWPDLSRGIAWRRNLARAGVRWVAASGLRIEGGDRVRGIAVRTTSGWRSEKADMLLLHDGVVPSTQIPRALDLRHVWNPQQHCWQPWTDIWGATSLPTVLAAGDGAGIGGAATAVLSGRIAVLGLRAETRAQAVPLQAERARRLAVRPFLDALYPPVRLRPEDTTVICRCEDVTAGQIRAAARQGCSGMNQLKAYTRCGMGPCQGRTCGPAATEVLADARGVPVSLIEPLRTRFPTKPVSVGELAAVE